jgi:hypothetical protein
MLEDQENYDKYLEELRDNEATLSKYADLKKEQLIGKMRNEYLEKNFLDEIKIDNVINSID